MSYILRPYLSRGSPAATIRPLRRKSRRRHGRDGVRNSSISYASLNETKFGLYEPSHGSAPDIAGQDKANPIATILSAAMMLRFSLDMDKEADAVETAVQAVLKEGYRTGDIMSEGKQQVSTSEMGDLICERIR